MKKIAIAFITALLTISTYAQSKSQISNAVGISADLVEVVTEIDDKEVKTVYRAFDGFSSVRRGVKNFTEYYTEDISYILPWRILEDRGLYVVYLRVTTDEAEYMVEVYYKPSSVPLVVVVVYEYDYIKNKKI